MSRIRIEKKGITNAGTECIVNAANEYLQGGSGVCGAIFKAAGWDQLQAACNLIGHCDTGDAVITPAFNLNAGYIIHAVGPVWQDGKHKEPQKLIVQLLPGCSVPRQRIKMSLHCISADICRHLWLPERKSLEKGFTGMQ